MTKMEPKHPKKGPKNKVQKSAQFWTPAVSEVRRSGWGRAVGPKNGQNGDFGGIFGPLGAIILVKPLICK